MTDRKLAASRANARLSKGPTSVAGKEKVSQNARKHHLYARKFLLPPVWAARIQNKVQPCIDTVDDPAERACLSHYLSLGHWRIELLALDTRLLNQHIARRRSFCRGLRDYTHHDPRFWVIANRLNMLEREYEMAHRAWKRVQKNIPLAQSIRQLAENKPVAPEPETLTLAAAAGARAGAGVAPGAPTSPIHHCAPHSPYRAVRSTPPP